MKNEKRAESERSSEVRLAFDRTSARILFFRAMERVAPEVLGDLRDRVLPRFKKLAPKSEKKIRAALVGAGSDAIADALMPVVRDWGVVHRLTKDDPIGERLLDWLEPVVVYSFMRWARQRAGTPLQWHFQDTYSVGARFEEPPLRIEFGGWAVLRESDTTFRRRAHEAFVSQLRAYMEHRLPDDDSRSAYERATRPRLPKQFTPRHFEWLALYQLKEEMSTYEIARQNAGSASSNVTVSKGIKLAAELVIGADYQQWLRSPARGGRPQKLNRFR